MRVQIQKWGNSLALRIPKAYAQEVNVKRGSTIELSFEKGKLILTPLGKKYRLGSLLAKIKKENIHDEQGFGPARGKEAW